MYPKKMTGIHFYLLVSIQIITASKELDEFIKAFDNAAVDLAWIRETNAETDFDAGNYPTKRKREIGAIEQLLKSMDHVLYNEEQNYLNSVENEGDAWYQDFRAKECKIKNCNQPNSLFFKLVNQENDKTNQLIQTKPNEKIENSDDFQINQSINSKSEEKSDPDYDDYDNSRIFDNLEDKNIEQLLFNENIPQNLLENDDLMANKDELLPKSVEDIIENDQLVNKRKQFLSNLNSENKIFPDTHHQFNSLRKIKTDDQPKYEKNDLTDEANYKLSKSEQEILGKQYTMNYSKPIPYQDKKRSVDPMQEIKLKISNRLMAKGLGPSLPSNALEINSNPITVEDILANRNRKKVEKPNIFAKMNQWEAKPSSIPSSNIKSSYDWSHINYLTPESKTNNRINEENELQHKRRKRDLTVENTTDISPSSIEKDVNKREIIFHNIKESSDDIDETVNDFHKGHSLDDLASGRLPKQLVDAIYKFAKTNQNIYENIWPALVRYRTEEGNRSTTNSFNILKEEGNSVKYKETEKMLRQLIEEMNTIIDHQVRAKTCLPLSPELQNFYDLILSCQQTRNMNKESNIQKTYREIQFNYPPLFKRSILQPILRQKYSIVQKLLNQYNSLPIDDQLKSKELKDILESHLIKLKNIESNENTMKRRKRQYFYHNTGLGNDLNLTNSQQNVTAEFSKLAQTVEIFRRTLETNGDSNDYFDEV